MADQYLRAPVRELATEMRAGRVTSAALVESILAQIESTESEIHAYTAVTAATAREAADQADHELHQGRDRGLLHGLPVSIKDLIDVKGAPATYGSAIFANHVAETDATVVRRLREAGAVIVGKTNTHEFALGGITPPTRNPCDSSRVPGGSSGGSAAAIRAGSALLSLGSDTGGSIRIPASYCGVVGLKPTYGLVSRVGVFPESWSLDHVGPIARCAEDAAALLGAIAGHDPFDHATQSSTPHPNHYLETLEGGLDGMRVGIPVNHFFDDLDTEVAENVGHAIDILEANGATLVRLSLPNIPEILGAHTAIDLAEIAANHRRIYSGHASEYQQDARQLIEAGHYVPASTYIDALRSRPHLLRTTVEAMQEVDAVATPTQPIVAPRIGEEVAEINGTRHDLLFTMVRLLAPFNFTGQPALSICCGHNHDQLPIGLQLVGKPYAEGTLLRIAHAYEQYANVNSAEQGHRVR